MKSCCMSHFLSIIIPCYNSEKTLTQAVESIFRQAISIPFEVVMVDDGSSDSTPEILKQLAGQHPETKIVFHSENRGGGAARNTAVEHSQGDIIFCLDSDDLLGENMLEPMIQLLIEKKLDGVGIHISRKFTGQNLKHIAFVNEFGYAGQVIPFESLFDKSVCALYSTFMHTRKAFDICGGYPTDHGFDTQAFAFRFLANGLKASVCPGATYLHRINFHRSYFIREYESGKFAENCMKIYEEFLFLFSEKIQEILLTSDLEKKDISPAKLLLKEKDGYAQNYKKLIQAHAQQKYEQELLSKKKLSVYDTYWLGCQQKQRGENDQALLSFAAVLGQGLKSLRVKQKFLTTAEQLTGVSAAEFDQVLSANKKQVVRQLKLQFLKKRNDLIRLVRQFI